MCLCMYVYNHYNYKKSHDIEKEWGNTNGIGWGAKLINIVHLCTQFSKNL